jgi:hypothetical protein
MTIANKEKFEDTTGKPINQRTDNTNLVWFMVFNATFNNISVIS